ncbi:MAG: hypothetical protein HYY78_10190 [Betaproteobacteria bacterium]|nr:hypothetical protein [Betaproteobacteria bacterium]
MERFPVELIYVVIFAGFVLFNWLAQQAARRRQQEEQAQAEEPGQGEPPPFEAEPVEYSRGRAPASVPAPAPAPVPVVRPSPSPARAAPSAVRRLHPVRALLKDKPSLRRAVILSMVLGPCRAQEPPEQR